MKIVIVKVLDGGIDLATLQQVPKSLLLEHGANQATMPVYDDQLEVIMSLIGAGQHVRVREVTPPAAPQPSMPVIEAMPDHVIPANNGTQLASFTAIRGDSNEPEIGETYSDPETGVSAI